ncbi:MAG: zinc ribbon domain-containing protein [Clostridia bacterium]|nr:zinc ribbon domain-containing protein [Clostridia bacterium]
MFCTKCGRELSDTETYCPYCGAMTASEPSALHDISTEAAKDQLKNEMADDAFKWGIVSLVGSLLGLLGFIFSFIARSKAFAYRKTFGVLEGRAKTGHILGRIGFAIGLCYLAFMTLFAAAMVYMGICGEFM